MGPIPHRRRGTLLRAFLSPAVVAFPAVVAAVGLWAGWSIALTLGIAVGAWIVAGSVRLRGPTMMSGLLAPGFGRDVSKLDQDHRRYLMAGFAARDRFEEAISEFGLEEEFGGMRHRIDEALTRLYDSLMWAQRAVRFVREADRPALERRLAAAAPGTAIAEELSAQLEEIEGVRARRRAVLDRAAATVAGLETLATKMSTVALQTGSPDARGHADEVAALRDELDAYVAALAEIEAEWRRLPPGLG